VFFVGSMLLLCMGVLGEYLGRVYDEVRGRPLSIISRVYSHSGMMPVQAGNAYDELKSADGLGVHVA
jgi:dolichol-phosphate mannosyltransferase